jgi:hypothetical protein
MYYLRTKPAASAIQFTVDKTQLNKTTETGATNGSASATNGQKAEEQKRNREAMVCSLQNKEDCLMCGSWMWKWKYQPPGMLNAPFFSISYSVKGISFYSVTFFKKIVVYLLSGTLV